MEVAIVKTNFLHPSWKLNNIKSLFHKNKGPKLQRLSIIHIWAHPEGGVDYHQNLLFEGLKELVLEQCVKSLQKQQCGCHLEDGDRDFEDVIKNRALLKKRQVKIVNSLIKFIAG